MGKRFLKDLAREGERMSVSFCHIGLVGFCAWQELVLAVAVREYWFETAKDVLFAVEFLLVQIYLIYHIVRALFFPRRRRKRQRSRLP